MEFRLREILNERGITIRAFAEKMGVVPNSLPLSVAYAPSLTSLQKYATALNIPCVELVRKPEHPTPITDRDMTDKFDLNEMALTNIHRIMGERQLMQKTVAEGAGISIQSLGQTLKNNKMSITTLEKIARGLDVEPWTLLVDVVAQREPQPAYIATLQHVEPTEVEPYRIKVDGDVPMQEDLFAQLPEESHAVNEAVKMATNNGDKVQQMVVTLSDGRCLRITVEEL